MAHFIIDGPKTLRGDYHIQGSKNAATPLIAATLLINDECILDNVPRVTDVEKMVELITSLGAKAVWTDKNQLTINTQNVSLSNMDESGIKSMRSSVLLIGPLLSRFNEITIPEPGGCFLGNRPLDTHFAVLQQFGAHIRQHISKAGKISYTISAKELKGTTIVLPEFSVTATENAILLAVYAKGTTTIKLAAGEPHVQNLITFLDSAGAKIEEKTGHIVVVKGVSRLHGLAHRVIPDMLEAGTLATAGALVGKGMTIHGVSTNHLDIVLLKLKEAGVKFEIIENNSALKILPTKDLRAFKLQSMPYPGFPTDLQEPFSLLATQCTGTTMIHDPLFEDRMRHIAELIKMGAKAIVCDPHRSLITGPSPLHGFEIKSPNIRGGAMLVIAGLIAQGETIIHDVEHTIDRGYEHFEERLNLLGAGIKRVA